MGRSHPQGLLDSSVGRNRSSGTGMGRDATPGWSNLPSTGTGDPRLKTQAWAALRTYWRGRGLPCTLCGQPIDYRDRDKGPRSLVVGHIIGRDEGGDDSINNSRPECATCSAKSGAQYLARKRAGRKPGPMHTREW